MGLLYPISIADRQLLGGACSMPSRARNGSRGIDVLQRLAASGIVGDLRRPHPI